MKQLSTQGKLDYDCLHNMLYSLYSFNKTVIFIPAVLLMAEFFFISVYLNIMGPSSSVQEPPDP